ncbi:MAG: flavocytochrome c [Sedimentibacter sp.]|uniref:flavocytochrome c n=1 Tax=Sedimentibacter sp. TaxID=1960295 RepID=UPI0029821332|nr:flavocytochrome c [Sedimentibacter sp.]MDW5298681.1 flavocytochrome c [Sedimentibacter sp.]
MKFKRMLSLLLAFMLVFSLAACQQNEVEEPAEVENEEELVSAVVQGEGNGKYGTVKVEVTLENSEIKDIKVIESSESGFTEPVFSQLIQQVIDTNSTDVDAITGATLTSFAFINGVKDAVEQSGAVLTAKEVQAGEEKVEDVATDIVIIGAGGAGLTAAIEATNAGAEVIVVEKNAFMGGNTNYATGGMNVAGTKYQEADGIQDSAELFYADTMKGGKNLNNPELLKVMTENSADTLYWLESMGADLSQVGISGGQSVNRIHKGPGGMPVGTHLMDVFGNQVKNLGIDVRLNTKAVEILADGNTVTGIKVENKDGNSYEINAKAVILASGGFGANPDMVVKFKPELEGFGTTNAPGATGDALAMVEKLDVSLTDIDQIQTHPTVVPIINEMITEGIRGDGAILVNHEGNRFVNELETRDVVSKAILDQEGATAFLVLDKQVYDKASTYEKYKNQGLLKEAQTLAELAEIMKVDAATLEETVTKYNEAVKAKADSEFGRASLEIELITAPYYAVEVSPAIHHTMGGVTINTSTQVINNSGEVVEGLYAAGEVTGGVHGANRIGGNAITDITVFGKIAGANAAAFVAK